MNFYRAVFPEKNFLENIHKKGGFWGTYPLILPLFVRAMTKNNKSPSKAHYSICKNSLKMTI